MMSQTRAYFPTGIANAVVMAFGFVPFAVSIWAGIAWMIWRQSITGFLSLFVVVPLLFIQLALFGFMLWLRPSIRTSRKLPLAEGGWYLGAVACWLAGVTVPGFVGGILQLLAIVVSGAGIWWTGRRSHQENIDNMAARAERMREHLGTPPGAAPKVEVITIEEQWVAREGASDRQQEAIDAEIIEERDDDNDDGPEWVATPRGER